MIRKPELKPYLKRVQAFVGVNEDHPALLSVCQDLHGLLNAAPQFQLPARLRPRDWSSRLRLELRRLVDAGVTSREIFTAASAVYLLAEDQPGRLPAGSRVLRFAMARAVLALRMPFHRDVMRAAKPARVTCRLSTLALDYLGTQLQSLISPVLDAAIRQQVFSSPSTRTTKEHHHHV